MENDKTDNSENFEALEKEIREAVAKGVHTRETVRRLTLNAMNAQHIDLASLQRIVAAIMHGIHDGAEEQIQRVISQTQTAKTQINEAVTGLDSALAGFAQASKLAVEEAASQAKKFSENELTRTHSELESLESLFLDTLHDTASAAQGLVADTLHDVIRHAKNNGTAVGLQLVETLGTFKHQIASIGHAPTMNLEPARVNAAHHGKPTAGELVDPPVTCRYARPPTPRGHDAPISPRTSTRGCADQLRQLCCSRAVQPQQCPKDQPPAKCAVRLPPNHLKLTSRAPDAAILRYCPRPTDYR